ncbi:MAG: hypothetical protein ACFFG0_29180 [Candidatus Thorarchaeota archaeon]
MIQNNERGINLDNSNFNDIIENTINLNGY